ncbi:MAG: hypothetical protein Q9182_001855 [Xanthomendoza sp. 2 TL-2023]
MSKTSAELVSKDKAAFLKQLARQVVAEGQTGSIDIKEERPALINKLIYYLYNCDYDDSNDDVQNEADSQSPQAGRLAVNAAMYTIGDRYNLNGLQDLAKAKFATALPHCWNKEDFPGAIRFIYENTHTEDRGLRECLVPTLIQHKQHLRSDEKFMDVVQTYGEFAVDLLDAWTYQHSGWRWRRSN